MAVVAATTDRMASAWLGDFAVAGTAGKTSDVVGGRRRRTVVKVVVAGEERKDIGSLTSKNKIAPVHGRLKTLFIIIVIFILALCQYSVDAVPT